MKQNPKLVGLHLQRFFVEYLSTQKRSSPETIASYRDTFRLLLRFVHEKHGIEPAALCVEDLSVKVVLSFLDYLEQERDNTIRSRNLRLSAIRSFFRVVALYEPTCVNQCATVLAIPVKRGDKKLIRTLSKKEVDALLAAPDLTNWTGRRDYALLLTLYNSGARISEIGGLKQKQVCFGTSACLYLRGKGRKERTVPLWSRTARAIRSWFDEMAGWEVDLAFPSASKKKLTRNGLNYILQRAVKQASQRCPSLRSKRVTPHVVRHTTATHLLQSGVDLAVIALWLGHESVETTHVYLESDLATKERSLKKLAPPGVEVPRFKAEDSVLAFLASL